MFTSGSRGEFLADDTCSKVCSDLWTFVIHIRHPDILFVHSFIGQTEQTERVGRYVSICASYLGVPCLILDPMLIIPNDIFIVPLIYVKEVLE